MWWAERSRSSSSAAFPDAGLGGQLFTVAQLTCSCATNIPAPEMKIRSPSWRRLRAFGAAYGIQRRMKIDDKVRLEGAR
jgi:hypothetical protein